MNRLRATVTTSVLCLAAATAFGQSAVDAGIPEYQRVSGISGNLDSIGSDTLNNLMTLWAEGFRRAYPGVRIQIEGKGSTTAPPALIEGTSQLGPMSRAMKPSEIDLFEKRFGYKPTAIRTAIDGLAVYAHQDNPIERLTLPQLDAIFSKTRRGGLAQPIDTWGQAGLTAGWNDRTISLYGRNSASGTYGYFKEKALFKGDYRDSVKEQPGSASVVQGVARDIGGLGYSGVGYKTSDVKFVALAKTDTGPYVMPTTEGILSGKYPLSRFLYVYVNKAPNRPADPTVREFLRMVLSQQGQKIVAKDGYIPLPAKIVAQELQKLD